MEKAQAVIAEFLPDIWLEQSSSDEADLRYTPRRVSHHRRLPHADFLLVHCLKELTAAAAAMDDTKQATEARIIARGIREYFAKYYGRKASEEVDK